MIEIIKRIIQRYRGEESDDWIHATQTIYAEEELSDGTVKTEAIVLRVSLRRSEIIRFNKTTEDLTTSVYMRGVEPFNLNLSYETVRRLLRR